MRVRVGRVPLLGVAILFARSTMTASKETPLQCAYTFSFMRRGKGAGAGADNSGKKEEATGNEPNPYENAIKTIASVSSVEEFWAVYDFLKRPSDLMPTTDYQ